MKLLRSSGATEVLHALRAFVSTPAFAWTYVTSLAVAIAATTTIFAVVEAIDLRELPFDDPSSLVLLHETAPTGSRLCNGPLGCVVGLSSISLERWKAATHSLESIGAYAPDARSIVTDEQATPIRTAAIEASLFRVLRTPPFLGRTFDTTDAQNPHVIVLGYDLWKRMYGGNRAIVGTQIKLTGSRRSFAPTVTTIIGVMPPHFSILSSEAWLPMPTAQRQAAPDRRLLLALGRIRAGRSIASADAEGRVIADRLARDYPATSEGWSAGAIPFTAATELSLYQTGAADAGVAKQRVGLFVVVLLVLLIAALNSAGLCVVRARTRARELSVRRALGASRFQVIRLIVIECWCLALVGSVVGIVMACWGIRAVGTALRLDLTGLDIRIDGGVLLFAVGVATSCALLSALAPVVAALRMDPAQSLSHLRRGAPGASRWLQHALVACEAALAVVVVTWSASLTREWIRIRYVSLGYVPHGVVVVKPPLPASVVQEPVARAAFVNELSTAMRSIPGVAHVAAFTRLNASFSSDAIVPVSDTSLDADLVGVDAEFFETMSIPIIRGRAFAINDRFDNSPVVIVDETVAAAMWPGKPGIGETIVQSSHGLTTRLTVVGIARSAHFAGSPLKTGSATIYRPLAQSIDEMSGRQFSGGWYLKAPPSASLQVRVRGLLHQATQQPVSPENVQVLEDVVDAQLGPQRFHVQLFTFFALFGMVLVVIGVYGLSALAAVSRKHEISIRMAVGAERRDIVLLVVRRGVAFCALGIAIGAVAATAMAETMKRLTNEIAAIDVQTIMVVGLYLIAIAGAAAAIPAIRAARANPATALRLD